MSRFYPLTISDIVQETPQAVSIVFNVPEAQKSDFNFSAGQYITIKHTINGAEVRRSYSLCSNPASGEIKVGIKKVENGVFSTFANTQLKINDTLEVMPPEGKFTLTPNAISKANYFAFAAGSGITPVLSMIKAVLEQSTDNSFTLVYGNKNASETMYRNELIELSKTYPERFKLHLVFSRAQESGAMFGKIDNSLVNYFTKNIYKDVVFNDYYLCGPEAMINEIKTTLSQQGVPENNIHFELFTSSIDNTTTSSIPEGITKITVTVDDEVETFSMSHKKTVLDAALDEGLDAPYSCQGGICSTCIARVTEGTVSMRKNQILTDAEVAEGLILTCQAHPTSATLEVDYDDV